MAKKLLLIVSAVITLLIASNCAIAFDGFRNDLYRWNGWYSHRSRPYIHHRRAMAFAPQHPIAVASTVVVEEKTITVWITNNNGSQTEVKLIPAVNGGYTGPKGEYYSTMPTELQLKSAYGLPCDAPVRNNVIFYLGKSNGSEIIVILTKDGSEFVGPKGERYSVMPTEEQLKLIYSK